MSYNNISINVWQPIDWFNRDFYREPMNKMSLKICHKQVIINSQNNLQSTNSHNTIKNVN